MDDDASQENDYSSWVDFEARGGGEAALASLPGAVRAIVEECRAQSTNPAPAAAIAEDIGAAEEVLPYTCRMYERSEPGEEDMLQLQWMRIDMSTMDSERCWGEANLDEEHDCGPDSGLVLPAIYSMDPAQVLPATVIGLPPELQRAMQGGGDGFDQWGSEDVPEDHLCKLGKDLTEALSSKPVVSSRAASVPANVVAGVASLSREDWSICLERYVDLRRCDPAAFAQVLSTAAPPTLDCLLGIVLPAIVSNISSHSAAADTYSSDKGIKGSSSSSSSASNRGCGEQGGVTAVTADSVKRDTAALLAICRLAASVAASDLAGTGNADPVRFRDKVSASELRDLGPLGKEAEVALAEAFFYGGAAGQTF